MKMSTVLSMVIAGSLVAGTVLASTNDPRIQQREVNQERRIDQGVKSGQLTPQEAGRLDAQQAKIQQTEEQMKADGKLTPKERRKLTRMQNRASDNIYRKKHNQQKVDVQ